MLRFSFCAEHDWRPVGVRVSHPGRRLPEAAAEGDYRSIAAGWRPLRSWVSFWLRAASPHTLDSLESGSYQHAILEESP